MTRYEKKLFKRANKAIKKTEKALKKAHKLNAKEREAVDKFCECARKRLREDVAEALETAIEALKQPERKKGRWEQQTEPMGWYDVECAVCSVCKASFDLSEGYSIEDIRKLFAYCPSCGAKMEGEECPPKDDTSHPFADDVLMGGD